MIDIDTRDYFYEMMRQLPEWALVGIASAMFGRLENDPLHSWWLMEQVQSSMDFTGKDFE
jgi:hypothetical protein